ncbi:MULTISPECIES: SMC-Scp complex subunit ScpB [unclassified Gemella]|uniref:SMC-Scp complex subunit ScpB n=1 Tax=unclassified Gemella TaxID=2624949 RepID=UPI001073C06B|nr:MULTISPECIES: SMC-Scp complex subunit ScpB [unclassified Gemella]MBF0710181.1 SMC-Scp complex subunit ScpB [Gemella sp. GL1.1]MBF0746481.1 SMC-Scp complex subunit ScpB [Gemella sp. 19428wG2_WT2a]NYS27525.1 SMC-Scp complex subunit ScpB [Gemella sp. GL1]TFU60261.1 SMC-Scp complex subunit ScpB [Gemella sp. WT2a]
MKKNYNILEALFFIKGEEGIHIDFYSQFKEISKEEARSQLDEFKEKYNEENSALMIKNFGKIYKMLVIDTIFKDIKDKLSSKKLTKLSKAATETLAIIAYKQPISKVEIEKIRGVASDNIITSLLDKELIFSDKVMNKVGRPKLYETTEYFLDIFGLESLDQLPKVDIEETNFDDELDEFLNQ